MRTFSLRMLFFLLLGMCALCAVQWFRENALRQAVVASRTNFQKLTAERDQLNQRAKAADAEMLRITAALTELRTSSAPKAELDAAFETNAKLKEQLMTASHALMEQHEALQKQASALQKAGEIIKQTTVERDNLVVKANEAALKYNALLKKQGDDRN